MNEVMNEQQTIMELVLSLYWRVRRLEGKLEELGHPSDIARCSDQAKAIYKLHRELYPEADF